MKRLYDWFSQVLNSIGNNRFSKGIYGNYDKVVFNAKLEKRRMILVKIGHKIKLILLTLQTLMSILGILTILCWGIVRVCGPIKCFLCLSRVIEPERIIESTIVSPDGLSDVHIVKVGKSIFSDPVFAICFSKHNALSQEDMQWVRNFSYESSSITANQLIWKGSKMLEIHRSPRDVILSFSGGRLLGRRFPHNDKPRPDLDFKVSMKLVTSYKDGDKDASFWISGGGQ